ncbi:TonB-dependent receptor [Spirosoma sp. BT702]|uniref:TonB-dependent receptor n=1 Tax=Spirosoma profusum TaxID=2771354 RepID=A0A927ARD1_9BACT|nr:TonB-dependent receptor [Spirosoma profusum]MBD2702071.1 TonB-dependent receptor [Spirosoma profusum]
MKKSLTLTLMKITAIQLFVALILTAVSYAGDVEAQEVLERRVNITIEQATLKQALMQVSQVANVKFVFNSKVIRSDERVSITAHNERLADVLNRLLKPRHVQYEVAGKQIIFSRTEPEASLVPDLQFDSNKPPKITDVSVSGTVQDEKGIGLPGVSIVLKGTNRGSTTDAQGTYRIDVPDASAVLIFSFVGYRSQEVLVGNQTQLNVTLLPDNQSLNEVVVVGYGSVKKSDLTGSVSSVGADKITQVKGISNVAQALQGFAAGVQVNQSSGQPGEAMIIKIRGTNSISGGNAPLYVVDGLPLDGLSAQLNPDDIDRIEVLKDASSTAIYGSRGANGVIIISTKKGKEGKPKISYNGYYGVQSLRKKVDLIGARDFAILQNEVITNDNASGLNTPQKALPWTTAQIDSLGGRGTDWQDLVYRNAIVQNHDLSVSGGSQNLKYYTSFGYYDQDGIIRNSNFKRMSFRVNLSYDISKKLSVSNSFSLQNSIYRQAIYAGADGGGGIPFTTMVIPPTQGPYDANGNYTKFTGVSYGETNPLGLSTELYNPSANLRLIGNTTLVYELVKGLKLNTSVGIDGGYTKSDYYAPSTISIGQPGGKASKGYSNTSTFVTEDYLTYSTIINKHTIDALGGFTYQSNQSENLNSGTGIGFITNDFTNNNISAATTPGLPSTGYSDSKLVSYLGRLNYNFGDKYYVTVTGRYDGSSRFSEDKKFAFFPSGAFAWRISEEPFMKQIPTISTLKLRTTYGFSGNQAIANYQTLARLTNTNVVFSNVNNIAYVQGSLAYNNLKWETTRQLDIGLDLGFLRDRIQLTLDYYDKKTEDLLLNVGLPTSSGFSTVLQNIGAVQNRGFEFQLTTVNTTGALRWNSVVTISHNNTKVLQLENDPQGNPVTYKEVGAGGNWFPIQVGQSINELYGYKVLGIYQTNDEAVKNGEPTKRAGDYKFWDRDGNGVVDGNDRSTLTHLTPKVTFGFNNNLTYKNFNLSLLFVGSLGNDIVNEFRKYNITLNGNWTPTKEAFNQRWTGSGNGFDVPSSKSGSSIRDYANSLWVENGSYVKLRDITLGYTLPTTLLKSAKISSVNVYVSAQNYLTITKYTGYDPEVSWSAASVNGWDRGNYPSMKSITAGLKVDF